MLSVVRNSLRLVGPSRRRRFVMVGLLSTVVSGLEAVSALLVLVILRFVLEPGSVPEFPIIGDVGRFLPGAQYGELVLWTSTIFAGFFVVRGGLFLFLQYAIARVSENTGVMLADRLVDGYLSMPYEFHLRRNSSELIRNAYDNVTQVVGGVFTPMTTLIAETTMTLAMLLVLLVASVQATLIAGAITGVMVLATLGLVQPRLKMRGQQRQRAAGSTLQHLQQGLGGLRDIKILGREAAFSRGFTRARQEMAEAEYHQAALAYTPRVTMEVTFLLLILGALALAVSQDAVGETLSTLGLFAYAGLRLQPSLQKIASSTNSLRYVEAAVDDLTADLELLDASRLARSDDRGNEPLPLREMLELRDVHFRYAGVDRATLRGINLSIGRGESIGIAGATGSGKTTLLDVICGLLEPTSGMVLVDGLEMDGRVRAWQQNLGVVHQNPFLLDDTLRRNIALGVPDGDIDEELLRRCIDLAQLSRVVTELPDGVETLVGERGVRLSGGQRQRVALARALYRQPTVLVLDEGTAALDNETERAVIRGLEELDGDTTVIMVAHRLTTIEHCQRIVYLESGRIVALGSFEELIHDHEGFQRMNAGPAT